ncbi:MAG: CRISPR-associated endonuclease Cas2 [Actinobacteria bacterium]|nr:CRISPR-associated endonuclease Cas2 [Actinomycetota bacterium]
MCMFDLPVVDPVARKQAQQFRNMLLDLGFEMAQFSVYLRHCASEPVAQTYTSRVKSHLPDDGYVNLLVFTDRQFSRMDSFHGRARKMLPSPPPQLEFW